MRSTQIHICKINVYGKTQNIANFKKSDNKVRISLVSKSQRQPIVVATNVTG
jgi:hypothetical protein